MYELVIPLTRNDSVPYGIAVCKISIIGIALATEKIELSQETMGGGGGRRPSDKHSAERTISNRLQIGITTVQGKNAFQALEEKIIDFHFLWD